LFRGRPVLCPSKVYDEFLQKYIAASKKVVVGDPADKETFMGRWPTGTRDRVENYIKTGVEEGAN